MAASFDLNALEFISQNPSCYHVVAAQAQMFAQAGYRELKESEKWNLQNGGKYYVIRNGSALIAFALPEREWKGYHIVASHSDSPALKLKENPEMRDVKPYVKLNVELYGGAILSGWFDRPLSVAGRVCIMKNGKIEHVLVDLDEDILMIPSLAIHMNRDINDGYKYNVQKDLLPLYGMGDGTSLMTRVAKCAGVAEEEILGCDLFVYNRQKPSVWGASGEFMSAPRLDDVLCAYASCRGILASVPENHAAVHVVFDNEEVGSSTRQGAASTFLQDVLKRISGQLHDASDGYLTDIAASFMLSADNAHALHPNYPEKCDPKNRPVPGCGVVLKFSANQKYTTDGATAARVRALAKKADVKIQVFVNRSDMRGGSTLGNISGNQVPVACADIGIAQFAMHSPYETCGRGDTKQLAELAKTLFSE